MRNAYRVNCSHALSFCLGVSKSFCLVASSEVARCFRPDTAIAKCPPRPPPARSIEAAVIGCSPRRLCCYWLLGWLDSSSNRRVGAAPRERPRGGCPLLVAGSASGEGLEHRVRGRWWAAAAPGGRVPGALAAAGGGRLQAARRVSLPGPVLEPGEPWVVTAALGVVLDLPRRWRVPIALARQGAAPPRCRQRRSTGGRPDVAETSRQFLGGRESRARGRDKIRRWWCLGGPASCVPRQKSVCP